MEEFQHDKKRENINKVMKWVSKDMENSHTAIDHLKNDLLHFEEFENYGFNSISHIKVRSQVQTILNHNYNSINFE